MYPARYRLPEVTAHVIDALERRRLGISLLDAAAAEASLTQSARELLRDAGAQFAQLADDSAYWQWVERSVLSIALPRYFVLARTESTREQSNYGLWRGGDLVSRAAYAAVGLFFAAVIWRTGLPKSIELVPLSLFIGGPLLPDLQVWFAKRQYAKKLRAVVDDMGREAATHTEYQSLLSPVAPVSSDVPRTPADTAKERP